MSQKNLVLSKQEKKRKKVIINLPFSFLLVSVFPPFSLVAFFPLPLSIFKSGNNYRSSTPHTHQPTIVSINATEVTTTVGDANTTALSINATEATTTVADANTTAVSVSSIGATATVADHSAAAASPEAAARERWNEQSSAFGDVYAKGRRGETRGTATGAV